MTHEPIEVTRAATGEHIAAVVDLFMAYLDFYRVSADRDRVSSFLSDRHERDESVLFLASADEGEHQAVVGFAHVYPTFESLSLAPSWTLNDLFVAPPWRGRGVGRALIDTVSDAARRAGATYVTLETAHDNVTARRLYEDVGFTVDDEYVHYALPLTPPN